jgi:hypothetical protein
MIIKGLPKFTSEKEFFDFLVKNEDTIFAQAKMQIKEADSFAYSTPYLKLGFGLSNKSAEQIQEELLNKEVLDVTAVINTTGILDSHKDVHLPGLWDKSLKENKRIMHVQEHKSYSFDKIISSGDDLKAYTKNWSWKELGYNFDGETQALMFQSKVRKERNPDMHKAYAKKWVDNHSVGMYYVKMTTCINSEDYPEQYENWHKYEQYIVNRKALDTTKYFWAVSEAKAIEGSAVPNGSNFATPTTSTKSAENSLSSKELAIKSWLGIR